MAIIGNHRKISNPEDLSEIKKELENDIKDILKIVDFKQVDLLAQKINEKGWWNQKIENFNDEIEMFENYLYNLYQWNHKIQMKDFAKEFAGILVHEGYRKRKHPKLYENYRGAYLELS